MTFTEITNEIKQAAFSLSPYKNYYVQLNQYAQGEKNLRPALIRACFSYLAFWPIWVLGAVLIFLPKFFMPQMNMNALTSILLSQNQMVPMIIGVMVAFILRGKKLLWPLGLILILQYSQITHVIFSFLFSAGVLAGNEILRAFNVLVAKDQNKKVQGLYLMFSVLGLALGIYAAIQLYLYMYYAGFFSSAMFANRLEFLLVAQVLMMMFQMLSVSIWGHFYSKLKAFS